MSTEDGDATSAANLTGWREALVLTVLLLLVIIGPFAANLYVPSLPEITLYFGTEDSLVQASIAVYFLSFSLTQLAYGPLSDRFGRRRCIMAGLLITAGGSLLCALAQTITLFLLARFIQGMGVAACAALYRSVLRDLYSGVRFATVVSYLSLVFALVPAISPIAGSYIAVILGWQANFLVILGLALSVLVVAFFYLPETNLYLNRDATRAWTIVRNYWQLVSHKAFMGYVLCSSVAFSGLIAYTTVSPFLLQITLGLSAVAYAWLAVYLSLGFAIGSLLNTVLIKYLDIEATLLLGLCIMLCAGLLMLLAGLFGILSVSAIMIPTVIFVVGSRFIFANAMAGALKPFAKMAGTAGALYGALQMIGSAVVSGLLSLMTFRDQIPLAVTFIGLSSVGLVVYWKMLKR